jgi:hypothetical protein
MTKGSKIVLGIGAFGIAAGAFALTSGAVLIPLEVADAAQRTIGLDLHPTRLGWMDTALSLSDADKQRLDEIAGQAHRDNVEAIRAIQGGERARLTRRDFELLRQDRRRAKAAYADVPSEKLLDDGWFNVSYRDRVPVSFCPSGNSSSTSEKVGAPAYLDGPCYMAVVKSAYTDRTDGPTATYVLAELRVREHAERVSDRTEHGYHFAMRGSGGSLSVDCEPGGKCVVVRARAWVKHGTRWTFDYVSSEWAGDPTAFESFPSFKDARSEEIDVTPSGTSFENHVGTTGDRPVVHGTVSPTAPPPPVPQPPLR